jgi:hypothetical protein
MRGGRDRELARIEIVVGASERQRLDRLRRGAQKGEDAGIAGRGYELTVANGRGMHVMLGLDEAFAADDDLERLHRPREDTRMPRAGDRASRTG